MKARSAPSIAILVAAVMVVGCAQDGTLFSSNLNTSSIDQQSAATQAPKTNPACVALASRIEVLNSEGVTTKVSKAAAKKYRMKTADLAKADELNKANAAFQEQCSDYPPNKTVAAPAPEPSMPKVAAKTAVKRKPPIPAPKPVAAAMPPQQTEAVSQSTTQP